MRNILVACGAEQIRVVLDTLTAHQYYSKRLDELNILVADTSEHAIKLIGKLSYGDAVVFSSLLDSVAGPRLGAAQMKGTLLKAQVFPWAVFQVEPDGFMCRECLELAFSHLAYKLFPHPHHGVVADELSDVRQA